MITGSGNGWDGQRFSPGGPLQWAYPNLQWKWGGYGILQVSSGISVFSILPAGFHGCPGGRSGCSETLFNSGVFYEFGGYFGISYPADRGCRGVRD